MRVDAGTLARVEEVEKVVGGRYRLLDPLGNGGMAVVWRARDQVLGRTVAVKMLAPRHADDPRSRRLIRAEAQAAAALSHPNIAQVYDYGESEEAGVRRPYVVMELVRGPTLEQRMSAGRVSPRFAMRVSAEIAAALAAAHADGLVHRDIKPANVMLTDVGAKVVDFGIAAAITPSGAGDDDFEVLGTPAYIAPERLSDDAVEPACDVYALGVILYRLLSGHSPWSADTTTQMLTAHVYVDPTPLPELPEVPPYVTDLCNRCLSKDPTRRPAAREVAALLAQGAGLRVVRDEPARGTGLAAVREPSLLIRGDSGRRAVAAPGPDGRTAAATPPPGDPRVTGAAPSGHGSGAVPAQAGPPDPAPPSPATGEQAPAAPAMIPRPMTPGGAAPRPPAAAGTTVADTPPAAGGAVPPPGSRPRAARRRGLFLLSGVLAVALLGTLLWLVLPRPDGDGRVGAMPPVDGEPAASTGAPASPTRSRPGAPPVSAARPTTPRGVPGGVPAATRTGAPDRTTARGRTSTPGRPAPTTTTPAAPVFAPQQRTLSSSAGSVTATCTSPQIAKILTSAPVKPWKVQDTDPGPGPAPFTLFKHGNGRVRMTVTCTAEGVPSASTDAG